MRDEVLRGEVVHVVAKSVAAWNELPETNRLPIQVHIARAVFDWLSTRKPTP